MALTFVPHPANEVYAMDSNGNGHITITFTETSTGTVGMVLINTKSGVTIPVTLTRVGNLYTATLTLPKGDYKYNFTDSAKIDVLPNYYFFSVGLVFVIVGHSLASQNGEQHATDHRVRIYSNYQAFQESSWKDVQKYSGGSYRNPDDIYNEAVANKSGDLYDKYQVGPWSRMAQLIAIRDDVTVAIINTAMGGSSVQMWADEAMARPFTHGFASPDPNNPTYNLYNSGIPFFHLQNVLNVFGKNNGVTAVLVQHGENDMDKTPSVLGKFYQEFINKAREGSGMTKLPFVIAKSAWLLNSYPKATQLNIDNTLASVDEALKITDYSYLGIDTHLLPQNFRGQPNLPADGHWNPEGSKEVGRMWAEKLVPTFLAEINKNSSTFVKPVPVVEKDLIAPKEPATLSDKIKSLNWVAMGIIMAVVGGVLFLLKFLFRLPVFRRIANVILVLFSIGLGGIYLGFNYFVNKNRAL